MEGTYHIGTRLTSGCERIDIEACLCQARDEGIYVGTVSFHRKVESGNQGKVASVLMVVIFFFQLGGHLLRCTEVAAVFAVVEHVLQQWDGRLVILVSPPVGSGDVAQVEEGIPVVVLVAVLEILP